MTGSNKYYTSIGYLIYSLMHELLWSYIISLQYTPRTKLYSPLAVGAPRMVFVEPLASRGAIRVTWSPPADLCGLTNPHYVIQYGTSRSSFTNVTQTTSSPPVSIMELNVNRKYFVRVAVHGQSWNGNFSSAQSVRTYGGVNAFKVQQQNAMACGNCMCQPVLPYLVIALIQTVRWK